MKNATLRGKPDAENPLCRPLLRKKSVVAGILAAFALGCSVRAADYFADAVNGDDAASGTSPATAWKSLARVNRQDFKPGDVMRFKRGCIWRESLYPRSGVDGKPVTYTTYGKGTKPIFEASMDFSKAEDWVEVEKGLWSTRPAQPPKLKERLWKMPADYQWKASFEGGCKGRIENLTENGMRFARVSCDKTGSYRQHNYIQVSGPSLPEMPCCFVLKVRMRASKPIVVPSVKRMRLNRAPYLTSHESRLATLPMLTAEWRDIDLVMDHSGPAIAAEDKPCLNIYLGDRLSEGVTIDFAIEGAYAIELDTAHFIPDDVGCIIINHGEKWGVKKWENPDWHPTPTTYDAAAAKIEKDFDFAYDPKRGRVLFKHPTNPGETYDSIELAMTRHLIRHACSHDIVYDGLWARYTGAHGMCGGPKRIIVRNCDFCWIGGGMQGWRKDPKTGALVYPIRYGNGIEFWSPARSNLVERCRFWQVYDAALTPQSTSPEPIADIVYRDNVIWQAEFSFEYWHHNLKGSTRNIVFEHNTCVEAGGCWSHCQRPRPNGAHLQFYTNEAPSENIVFRNNIFCRTVDRSTRLWDDWTKNAVFSRNLYWIPQGRLFTYDGCDLKTNALARAAILKECAFGPGREEFARYQKRMKLDLDSIYGEPVFENEGARDYRLKSGSPGKGAATDGTDIGARNMPGLDADQSAPKKASSPSAI